MALRWRYGNWYIRIRHEGKDRLLSTGLTSKQEAKRTEKSVSAAIKSGDFRRLDDLERKLCEQLLACSGDAIPELPEIASRRSPATPEPEPEEADQDVLTLWEAVEIMMKSPVVAGSRNCERHQQVLAHHIIPYFGPEHLIRNIWIPDIEGYLAHRGAEGAAGSTVAKDKAALSILFSLFAIVSGFRYVLPLYTLSEDRATLESDPSAAKGAVCWAGRSGPASLTLSVAQQSAAKR